MFRHASRSIGTKNTTNIMNANTLDEMLRKMPSLKEIHLDLYYVENDSTDHNVYPLVEKVTLQSTKCMDLEFQTLLDRCIFKFPNIKHLHLYSFSGGDSLVKLKNYSLESLAINATPSKLKQLSKSEYDFFVIQVEDMKEARIYKIQETSLLASRIQ